jgi:SAM-dependent methyltransferase
MMYGSQIELLLKIAKEYSAEQLAEAVSVYRFPEVFYHFAPSRWNLISWFDGWKGKKVLEIGSECGAYTSYLTRQASRVTCLETSALYQEVNEARHKGTTNTVFLTGAMNKLINTNEKYDCILITQAFAKAASYVCHEDQYDMADEFMASQKELLKQASELLTKDGRIILAVDNRMGLKYFAGAKEPNTGEYFGGLEGQSGGHGERAFTSAEMEKIFAQIPNLQVETYYPYPDYRYPKMIYSEHYLPKKGELVQNDLDLDAPNLQLYNVEKAFDMIIDHETFPLFSNSFMYILERNPRRCS